LNKTKFNHQKIKTSTNNQTFYKLTAGVDDTLQNINQENRKEKKDKDSKVNDQTQV
jgi:hypothetical protein